MAARVSISSRRAARFGGAVVAVHVPDGALVVGEDGRIVAACAWEALPSEFKDLPSTDLRPCWILPGLVDLHTHLPQAPRRGDGWLKLMPWLRAYIYPTEMRFMDPAHAVREARRFFHDLLSWARRRRRRTPPSMPGPWTRRSRKPSAPGCAPCWAR